MKCALTLLFGDSGAGCQPWLSLLADIILSEDLHSHQMKEVHSQMNLST